MNIIWNAILCTYLFNLSVTNDVFYAEFSMPSCIYFILFAVFEFRLFFFVIRSNYTSDGTMDEFRKVLLKNYIVFCIY